VTVSDNTYGDRLAIREALQQFGRLNQAVADLSDEADLFAAGFTSHATVNVMLAIEDALGIEFPDELLNRSTFVSIDALAHAVGVSRGER
jgi:acyl carrier protein